jgi:hypothetical protein
MADLQLEQRFALTIIPARAFRFLITPAEQRAALRGINRHLVPGGHLVNDLFDPSFEHLLRADFKTVLVREVQDPRSGHRIAEGS